ncbi:MAG: DUF3822 family protein [Cytophagales bacterium]|nr:DUF3822 family protein [Cytophagales bacterium]MDW8384866.1 DUF3822 family protein [Flammeovirgaceae bacterium]
MGIEADIYEWLRFKVKDESKFDINLLRQYILKVRLASSQLEIAVIDSDNSIALLYELYEFESCKSVLHLQQVLQEFWKQHHCINAGFWKEVIICIVDTNFVILPAYFYEADTLLAFLRLNTPYDMELHHIFEHKNAFLNLKCVFYVDEQISTWFRNVYPEHIVSWQHATMSFINQLTNNQHHTFERCIHVEIYAHFFIVVIFQQNSLLFCNAFTYHDSNTFLYFLLLVVDELELTTRYTRLVLYGNFSEYGALYRKVKAYFRQVDWAERPKSIAFSRVFDEIPEYMGYGLF